jgi:hypothetical protein
MLCVWRDPRFHAVAAVDAHMHAHALPVYLVGARPVVIRRSELEASVVQDMRGACRDGTYRHFRLPTQALLKLEGASRS